MSDSDLETLATFFGWTEEEARAAEASRLAEGLPDAGALPAPPPVRSAPVRSAPTGTDTRTSGRLPEAPDLPKLDGRARYTDQGSLGKGGMGEVRRVHDFVLDRSVALKRLHPVLGSYPVAAGRFVTEARTTAQLQHPAIVPVHNLGQDQDGNWFFTMREVRGRSLKDVITDLHRGRTRDRWVRTDDGWTFRRVVEALFRVCQAVAYAHEQGVLHRDIKPSNIMLGEHGEVLLVDWGLAEAYTLQKEDLGASMMLDDDPDPSTAFGTPAYMPPEQALGQVHRMGPWSDVYALGATLYHLLAGRPPYRGAVPAAIILQVQEGPPEPLLPPAEPRPDSDLLPVALVRVVEQAMARHRSQRIRDAHGLGARLRAWLDGEDRRRKGREVVAEAESRLPMAAALRARAAAQRRDAAARLAAVPAHAPEAQKRDAWALEASAERMEAEAHLAEVEHEQLLHAALTHAPRLPEAHAALVARYRRELDAAEAGHDARGAARAAALLEAHIDGLSTDHPAAVEGARHLAGNGSLSLEADPPYVHVRVQRFTEVHRRLVPVAVLGPRRTPVRAHPLPMGSYRVELSAARFETVVLPVQIRRGEDWELDPPEGHGPAAVRLPMEGELGPDDCFVPAGWCWTGSMDGGGQHTPWQRRWVRDFVMRRFPVTNAEFITFLDDLVARGRGADAARFEPRLPGGPTAPTVYRVGPDGRYMLAADGHGDVWRPDDPVVLVGFTAAQAYADWYAAATGRPWRLPDQWEWEKAARGVDGRAYPWGDHFDPAWACTARSHAGKPRPASVHAFDVDESPYGVRGMAGNVRDWTASVHDPTAKVVRRIFRGGSWGCTAEQAHLARWGRSPESAVGSRLGFRLARDLS